MMTTEGWVGIMSNGIDARGIEKMPEKEYRPAMALYFVLFMILGSFLLINLFTAVITDHFNKIKASKEIGADALYSESRIKEWIDCQNIGLRVRLKLCMQPPEHKIRIWFYRIVTHPLFDILIIAAIILNTIVLAMKYARMSDGYALSLSIINYIFVFLYNIEFLFKIIGLGKQYFTHDRWNIFDFI